MTRRVPAEYGYLIRTFERNDDGSEREVALVPSFPVTYATEDAAMLNAGIDLKGVLLKHGGERWSVEIVQEESE